MGQLQHRASAAMNAYRRKGGKQNRRKQVAMALRFVEYLEFEERLRDWDHLSAHQIIRYYKSRRELSARTIYNHFLAVRELVEQVRPDLIVPEPKLELFGQPKQENRK